MNIYAISVDGSIPVPALLFPDEELLAGQDGVGLYNGNMKVPNHQQGSVHVTSHRLIYIDDLSPRRRSLEFPLNKVIQTEFYAGFLKSSAKITLFFEPPKSTSANVSTGTSANVNTNVIVGEPASRSGFNQDQERETTVKWECEICGNKNVSTGLVPSTVCQLCGVPRSSTSSRPVVPVPQSSESRAIPSAAQTHAQPLSSTSIYSSKVTSKSLPSSTIPTPRRNRSPSPSAGVNVGGRSRSRPGAGAGAGEGSDTSEDAQVACAVCTFLNYPSLRNCEMCGSPLPKQPTSASRAGRVQSRKSEPSSRHSSPNRDERIERGEDSNILKLSFRKGGDKALYEVLKTALTAKAWDIAEPVVPLVKNRTGIHGLMETRRSEAQSASSNMQTALQDLEALRKQAKSMVELAQSFNKTLMESEAQRQQLPEDAQFIIQSSMARLGLQSLSTSSSSSRASLLISGTSVGEKEGGKEDEKWLEDLARDLGTLLTGGVHGENKGNGGFMHSRGMIALDEVWGAWNRTRGVDLIPPSTFIQVLPLLPLYTSPSIYMRTFSSKLKVVHTPWFSQKSFDSRLETFLGAAGPKTTTQVAAQENISVVLVAEMIENAERGGIVIRAEGGGTGDRIDVNDEGEGGEYSGGGGDGIGGKEIWWWPNYFKGYVWDGD